MDRSLAVILVYVLLVPAATALGFVGLGGNALAFMAAGQRSAAMGAQVRPLMRLSAGMVRRGPALLSASGLAYLAGLGLALVAPTAGLLVAFVGGIGLGFGSAAYLVQMAWRRMEPRLPPEGTPVVVPSLGEILRAPAAAIVGLVGGVYGLGLVLAMALANRDIAWLPWVALAPLAQVVVCIARLRRSSGPIRKAP